MKIAPAGRDPDQNEAEATLQTTICQLTTVSLLPDIFGMGKTNVEGRDFTWLILERATCTMSDMMLHPRG